ncbi:Kinesin-like protein [Rhynchospora pubera]|uniref:Kinesin-like protein n=1 Tax=Rhynchospora pubera TaxID=906938 RepID=A0AAV8D726_9POAL|nr:Kinesin-like protein [Rhynchospora pubera]
MSNVTVCVRFRPLNSRERRINGDLTCIHSFDSESFVFKDEKEDIRFCFDKVFYSDSEQLDVYEFLASPIVEDVMNGLNGAIITYGQTGAGKTYSMEGPSILQCDEHKRGLLQRVTDELFGFLRHPIDNKKFTIKMSMVEIYMEKVRDLFDLSKDNLQIKESKTRDIFISGATEITITNSSEVQQCLSIGIANRAVGETQMNLTSSRSHCLYIFIVQHEERSRSGKFVLVDLAGSEKVDKTGAAGRLLEEAKTINKSLSALGNVINALTSGKTNHVPYRDSKLTRFLQDALGGNSRTALLCCCSPSPLNASESLSTLRFGTRLKLIKSVQRSFPADDDSSISKQATSDSSISKQTTSDSIFQQDSYDRIVSKLKENLKEEHVDLLEKLFIMEGIFSLPQTKEEIELAVQDVTARTITTLHQAVEDLKEQLIELQEENHKLRMELVAQKLAMKPGNLPQNLSPFAKLVSALRFLFPF